MQSTAFPTCGETQGMVTASRLYDHVSCPRRVDLDLHADPALRTPVSPFVRLLWERGSAHEADVVKSLPATAVRLAGMDGDSRWSETLDAIRCRADVIHGGRISAGDLLGDPDLLLRRGDRYVAADIKSGSADEDGTDETPGRPKQQYAVQVALYTDILERMGICDGRAPEIWDGRGRQIAYDLNASRGPRTPSNLWDLYARTRDAVRAIVASPGSTRGALSAACGLCHWREACKAELVAADDLTQIPSLGRAARDAMGGAFPSVAALAAVDPETYVTKTKTAFAGVGPDRLRLYHARARLLSTPGAPAYLRVAVAIPVAMVEVFFDIEADPMRDIVYLHGFIERRNRDPESDIFTPFFADLPDVHGERRAFADAIAYLAARPDAAVFYYSKYERTAYRKLQRRFPDVCTAQAIEDIFTPPRSTDLFCDVVAKATEWPVRNHSIKTLAKHLGFAWRDSDPSGAASIEWYHRWVERRDPATRQRILDYNEDDCRATAVVLDGIRALPLRASPES